MRTHFLHIAACGGCLLLTTIVLLTTGIRLSAQDDNSLQLFGSMQTIFFHQEAQLKANYPSLGLSTAGTETRNTFAMQQLDIFLRKEMCEDLTAFVDLEF